MREESDIQKEIASRKNMKPDIKDLIDKWIKYLNEKFMCEAE